MNSEEPRVLLEALDRVAAPWWDEMRSRERVVRAVVVGPRRSGKTTWFKHLATTRGDVVWWDALAVGQHASARTIWADLWRTLNLDLGVGPDGDPAVEAMAPQEYLDTFLEREVTLVVDQWDHALDARGAQHAVSDACYEVLDTLANYCHNQDLDRPGALGLVLVTGLPDVGHLGPFARAARRPGFQRLSGLVIRCYQVERFPLLDAPAVEVLLSAHGLSGRRLRRVARDCGGWPPLLLAAARAAGEQGGWTPAARTEVRDDVLPVLLDDLWRVLAHFPPVAASGLDPQRFLERELAKGRDPARFGLPHELGDPRRAAPLIRELLHRVFLFVDTENLGMSLRRQIERDPALYPEGNSVFIARAVPDYLSRLARQYDIAPDDIVLVGRNPARIAMMVGANAPGLRLCPDPALDRKIASAVRTTGSDSTDDAQLLAEVRGLAERHPKAVFVLVTGDQDHPFVLSSTGVLGPLEDRLLLHAPFGVAHTVRERFAPTGRLQENTFPLRTRTELPKDAS